MIGQTIAHYQVLEKLGQGGMGVVYKARDTRLQRLVALKVLSSDKVVSSDRRARFIREAQSASALNNPHIVTIYDAHAHEGVDYLAMEYIEGRTLDKLVSRRGLPVGETLRLALPIADALTAAHAAGIIHRDLKPGNIMVANGGQVKVLDFGLAKRIDHGNSSDDGGTQTMGETEPPTGEGTVLGTAAYMSPEQAAGKPVDARTDIFSFGAVLYEMLTGRRPFAGDSWSSTLAAVLRDEPKPLSELAPGIPPELERIVARCLRKDLDRRFQHMADIKVALAELKEESDSGVSQRQSPAATSVRTTAPRWRNVTIAAACVALSLGISA
jgi:eukaryotic-like serine/threonine-protein kinase